MIPSKTTGDLLAGMWMLLNLLGGVPRKLLWDNETGIGKGKLTAAASSFAGTLATRIIQLPPRDPESKGIVERTNGFMETSFMPGRTFTGIADFNAQLGSWLPVANMREHRRIGGKPQDRHAEDLAAMTGLPPVAPAFEFIERTRLPRDYYVRVLSNDYSVDPAMIGRLVDIRADLGRVRIFHEGRLIASHDRVHARHQTVIDLAHVATAKKLREAFQERQRALARDQAVESDLVVAQRSLGDYDDLFEVDFDDADISRGVVLDDGLAS